MTPYLFRFVRKTDSVCVFGQCSLPGPKLACVGVVVVSCMTIKVWPVAPPPRQAVPSAMRSWRHSSTAGRSSGAKGTPAAPGSSPRPTCWIEAAPAHVDDLLRDRAGRRESSAVIFFVCVRPHVDVVEGEKALGDFVVVESCGPDVNTAGAHRRDARLRASAKPSAETQGPVCHGLADHADRTGEDSA